MRKTKSDQQLELDLRGKGVETDPVRKFVLEVARVVPMIMSAAESAKQLHSGNVAHARASIAYSLVGLHQYLDRAVKEIQDSLNADEGEGAADGTGDGREVGAG